MNTATNEKAVYQTASAHVVKGDPRSAINQLTAALEELPDSGRLWELRGEAHLAAGEPIDAIDCLERASCLAPLTNEARFALAHAYELSGKYELASDLFALLADCDELPLCLLEPLASALGRINKPALAIGVFSQAAARMPTATAPLLGMSFYQRRMGFEPERILPVLFRALHLDPEDIDLRMTLARMLHECGQPREAAELLGCVEPESWRCPSCLAAMQKIFEEAGDQERAMRCINTLVALAEESED